MSNPPHFSVAILQTSKFDHFILVFVIHPSIILPKFNGLVPMQIFGLEILHPTKEATGSSTDLDLEVMAGMT